MERDRASSIGAAVSDLGEDRELISERVNRSDGRYLA